MDDGQATSDQFIFIIICCINQLLISLITPQPNAESNEQGRMKRQGKNIPDPKTPAEIKRQKSEHDIAFEEDAAAIGALLQIQHQDAGQSSTTTVTTVTTTNTILDKQQSSTAAEVDTDQPSYVGQQLVQNRRAVHGNGESNHVDMAHHVIRDDSGIPQAPALAINGNGNGHGNGHTLPGNSDGENGDDDARDWLSAPQARRAPRVGNDFQAGILPQPEH
eukprot:scaffold7275_cov233-Chaetoceros_neogracile.AAC.8